MNNFKDIKVSVIVKGYAGLSIALLCDEIHKGKVRR
mgnify:FL=1